MSPADNPESVHALIDSMLAVFEYRPPAKSVSADVAIWLNGKRYDGYITVALTEEVATPEGSD